MKAASLLLLAAGMAVLPGGTLRGLCADRQPLPPLTAAASNPRLPGKFVWADLVTDNVPASEKFYSGLFGWQFYDYGGYLIGHNDDRPLCGMFYRERPENKNAKPRWFGYVSVPSVSGSVKTITNGGGKLLMAPRKFARRGEQAVFADAEGAVFGVIKSSSGDPEDFLADPGDWIWIQLMSRDARKAAEFYKQVGAYDVIESAGTNRLSDYVLSSAGYARATVLTIPKQHETVNPTWLLFVRVKQVGESVEKAKALGGKVLIAPKPELFEGRIAVVADPAGAAIGLMEWPEDMAKGGN